MAQIEWREPPAGSVGTDRERLVALLKENPGRWARVQKDMKSRTSPTTWRKLGLEALASPAESDPKRWDIYARAPETTKGGQAKPAATKTPAIDAGQGEERELVVPAGPASPAKAKKAPLVAQKVSKPRGPEPTEGDLEAQARVKAQMAARMVRRG